ncbi:MAG: dipeptidase [Acidobacteria bacterium]|nr:dipeptidase [Acidobacteriota bacterium]MCA1651214.1 dipeptidase [Acidobacteriota bacterium]
MPTRREALTALASAGIAAFGAPLINRGRHRLLGAGQREYSTRAVDLVRRATVIDMLSPLTLDFPKFGRWMSDPDAFTAADLEPFRTSGIHVFHVAVGTGGPNAYVQNLEFFTAWNSFLANQDQAFLRIDSAADLDRVKASGRIGVLLGIQNAEHFRSVNDVDTFYAAGQRVSQLTYNTRNLIGNGSTERRDEGLSDFGVAIVERMNRTGMTVDVSHCGDRTTLDAFEASRRPVLITHSNCRALVPGHPRCKTDEAIRTMAAKGGVMGITGVRMFVRGEEPTTIEHFIDHIDHVARLTSIEHVGIGSDMDLYGYDAMKPEENKRLREGYKGSYGFREKIDIEGLDHPQRMFDVAEALIRRKYKDTDIELVLGGNFKRVLAEIWKREPAPASVRGA